MLKKPKEPMVSNVSITLETSPSIVSKSQDCVPQNSLQCRKCLARRNDIARKQQQRKRRRQTVKSELHRNSKKS